MEELRDFLKFYDENKIRIKGFLGEFEKKPEDKQMFGELVFCLCTPQSKAKYCRAFVESVKRKVSPPLDAYDAAAWSAITPLSMRSIAEGNAPQYFPDFTRGRWIKRKPVFALDDEF